MGKKEVVLGQPEVGHLVRKLRCLTGLSQEEFAATLGVAFSTINRWENGHIQPSPLAIRQLKTMISELSRSPTVELQQQSQALLDQYFQNWSRTVND